MDDQSPPSSPFHGFEPLGKESEQEDPLMMDSVAASPAGRPESPDSPFHGFSNSDIPQPMIIKTEPGQDRT
jgi:hypothetical protein